MNAYELIKTTKRRFVVTAVGGSRNTVEVEDDPSLERMTEKERNAEVMKRLRAQGVEVVSVITKVWPSETEMSMDPNEANPVALGTYKVKANVGKGQGGLTLAGEKMSKSQVLMSGGTPEDDQAFNKIMGLSFLGRNKNANKGARGSTLGPGMVETDNDGTIDYKPIGVQGGAQGKATSLQILAREREILKITEKLR